MLCMGESYFFPVDTIGEKLTAKLPKAAVRTSHPTKPAPVYAHGGMYGAISVTLTKLSTIRRFRAADFSTLVIFLTNLSSWTRALISLLQKTYDVEVLSDTPRLLLVRNFLTVDECNKLIEVRSRALPVLFPRGYFLHTLSHCPRTNRTCTYLMRKGYVQVHFFSLTLSAKQDGNPENRRKNKLKSVSKSICRQPNPTWSVPPWRWRDLRSVTLVLGPCAIRMSSFCKWALCSLASRVVPYQCSIRQQIDSISANHVQYPLHMSIAVWTWIQCGSKNVPAEKTAKFF